MMLSFYMLKKVDWNISISIQTDSVSAFPQTALQWNEALRSSKWFCVSFFWLSCLCSLGLHRNPAAAEHWERQPGSSSVLRPWGCWLWHQLPAPHAGLCHEPLRAARCSHVWLHKHACLRERCPGQGEIWTPASGSTGWWQFTRGKESAEYVVCMSRVPGNTVLLSSPFVSVVNRDVTLMLLYVKFNTTSVDHFFSPIAILAYGNRLRPRLFGCLWHSMDGTQLGSGSDGSGCASRKVLQLTIVSLYTFTIYDLLQPRQPNFHILAV